MKKLSYPFLSKILKTNIKELKKIIGQKEINGIKYRYPNHNEKKNILIRVLKKINLDTQIINAKYRKKIWFDGWNENKKKFIKTKDKKYLIPMYYAARKEKVFRLDGKFIISDKNFEIKIIKILRKWYAKKYMVKAENIYEFGCGTGHNLVDLNKILSDKNFYGLDFVKSSVDIINSFKQNVGPNFQGVLFNIEKPKVKFKIKKNSVVLTSGALEQLGGKINNFVNYLIKQKPKLVLHVEPAPDFYNLNTVEDELGITFHKKRGYTSNLISILNDREKKKKINIINSFKSPFGSLMMEGYNIIIWKINKKKKK